MAAVRAAPEAAAASQVARALKESSAGSRSSWSPSLRTCRCRCTHTCSCGSGSPEGRSRHPPDHTTFSRSRQSGRDRLRNLARPRRRILRTTGRTRARSSRSPRGLPGPSRPGPKLGRTVAAEAARDTSAQVRSRGARRPRHTLRRPQLRTAPSRCTTCFPSTRGPADSAQPSRTERSSQSDRRCTHSNEWRTILSA